MGVPSTSMFNPFFRSLLVKATMVCRRALSRRSTTCAEGKPVCVVWREEEYFVRTRG
jgi:hypothetical protein